MLRIGITGGIGSGKTTVCNMFEQLGVKVYKADLRAKDLYQKNEVLQEELRRFFGDTIFENGQLNRAKLAQLVFSDSQKLNALNAIVHPFVFRDYEAWCAENNAEIYTLKEAAILFESGSYKQLHKVVGVLAPLALRLERAMQRDGLSEEEVKRRMDKQMPQDELANKCDFIIQNDGENSLIKQVMALDLTFKKLAPNYKK